MSANSALNSLQFKNIEDKVNYWRNQAFALSKENEEFCQRIDGLTEESLKRHESPTASPAAKSIKEESIYPMDFSNICEDVQGLLMQHFNKKDLLTMSEVSKNWNKRVEAGISEKATLNLPQDVRKYRDIELSREYKHVSLKLGKGSNLEALSKVANSAKNLKIILKEELVTAKNLKIVVQEEEKLINFPHLNSLELEVISHIDDFSWISKVRMDQLEELIIKGGCFSDVHDQRNCPFCFINRSEPLRSQENFYDFFLNLKNLKSLDLFESEGNFLFTLGPRLRQPLFQLETLRCRDLYPFEGVPGFESLKSLTLSATCFLDYESLSRLKKLTTFKLINFIDHYKSRVPTRGSPQNKSIRNLSIEPTKDTFYRAGHLMDAAIPLLKAAPEVETLYVYMLGPELVRFMAETNMKMKTVKYTEILDDTFEEYDEMRQTQPNINRDIQFIQEDFDFE